MATDKAPETKKDVEANKAPETGEPAIDYLVEGLTEEQLKGVSGGLGGTLPNMQCTGMDCKQVTSSCYTWCQTMGCRSVSCKEHLCGTFCNAVT